MRVVWSAYGSRGCVEPVVGPAVRLRALSAAMRVCAPADERCDALVATGVMPVGVWR